MGYTAESIIAGGEQSYTGRGFNASLQGFYCRQIVINEDVTASGFLAQDINGDDITSEVVDTSSITRLKIGQLLTFRTPVYRVTASDGSMTFYGEGQTRELPDPYLGTTLAPYSLAFDARVAEQLSDYEANTLYFRDSNFNRVGATFSRSTTATRVNKQGLIESVAANVPRIDYSDGSAKLLMEPSRTNIIPRSEFDAGVPTGWTVSFGAGTFTHTLTTLLGRPAIIHNQATSGRSPLSIGIVFAPSTTYTIKMYVPSVEILSGSNALILVLDGSGGGVSFNPSSIVNNYLVGTFTTAASAGSGTIRIGIGASSTALGSVTFGMPQLEAGSYPTSYIPTSGSAVTRNRDDVIVGYNSNYLPTAASTIHIKFDTDSIAPASSVLHFYGATSIFRFRDNWRDSVTTAGNLINDTSHAISNNGGTLRYFGDGSFVKQNSGATLSTGLTFQIQSTNARSIVDKIILFPTALTDSECEQLTS